MTRSRPAAIAALCASVLLVTASIGEAQREDRYRAEASCKTRHTTSRDFVKTNTKVLLQEGRGPDRRGGASAFRPAPGVKVIVKLIDRTPQNGNNVVGKARKRATTNDNGVAKTRHEVNGFGNYRLKVKAKTGGEVVATDEVDFGYADRVSGECDPPLTGRP